jgi:hypothetical protein
MREIDGNYTHGPQKHMEAVTIVTFSIILPHMPATCPMGQLRTMIMHVES